MRLSALPLCCTMALMLTPVHLLSEPTTVTYLQGSNRSFLIIRCADGKAIATGDNLSVARGSVVHSRLTFRFRDGSLDDETTVFTQGKTLSLISDHHIQRGPSFPKPIDIAFVVATGQVTMREAKDGKTETRTEHVNMPPDLSNGLLPTILQNLAPSAVETKVSMLVGSPKPRLVKISIKPTGQENFRIAGASFTANRYSAHIELGGITGVIAPIVGKQPADITLWTTSGVIKTFLKEVGQAYEGGPMWTTEVASPAWSVSNQ